MVSLVGCGIWLYRFLIFGFFLTIIIVDLLLIKSLKRSRETYCFCSVSSYYYYSTSSISSFSFHQNFVWMSLSNYWMNCSEIWGHGRNGCEVVQEGFKMSGSTAGPWVCPKPLIFCPDYFSLAIERIVLNFLYDKYWNIVLQKVWRFKSLTQGSFLAKLQQKCDIEQWNLVQGNVLLVYFTFCSHKKIVYYLSFLKK